MEIEDEKGTDATSTTRVNAKIASSPKELTEKDYEIALVDIMMHQDINGNSFMEQWEI